MSADKKKWYEVSLSVREVPESEVPEQIRTKSASQSYREGWDKVFGPKEKEESPTLN